MGIETVVDGDHLTVRLTGFDRVLAIKDHLVVPLSRVSSTDVIERKNVRAHTGNVATRPRHPPPRVGPSRVVWARTEA